MTKDKFNWKFCLCCGLFIWLVINLLQGIFTEIHEDEAYYALYGEHLAWGYFDHPPMVGLMTFLSSIFFSGTLGVRFFTILASCLSLWVIWKIANLDCFEKGLFESPLPPLKGGYAKRLSEVEVVEPVETPTYLGQPFDRLRDLNGQKAKVVEPVETPTYLGRPFDRLRDLSPENVLLFFTLACSIVMFNIYGFVTTPDVGLILFSALFLLVYQRYLAESTWPRTLLMGVLMACMIYSKYHAFLLLGLIVLSNLKLLKDGKFYVACLVALALLMPHILWQIQADFPSFKYHLSQRSEPFRWSYFLEYLPNQLLVFNPFTFGAVVYVLIKSHSENTFERGLRFILVGFFLFFWLMTFRGHVEPHWTIVGSIPVVVLLYRKALIDEKLRKYAKRFILPSLLLVLAFRVALVSPLAARFGFGGKKALYKAIETVAGEHPVVFRGSFQEPSLYHYFTGKESSSLRAFYDRKTQFDLWQFDTAWTGKPVFIYGNVNGLAQEYQQDGTLFKGYLMRHYQSPNRLVTEFKITHPDLAETPVLHHGDTLRIAFSIHNPLSKAFVFQNDETQTRISLLYLYPINTGYCHYDDDIRIEPHSTYSGELFTVVNDDTPIGKNRIVLSLGDGVAPFITEENHLDVLIEE